MNRTIELYSGVVSVDYNAGDAAVTAAAVERNHVGPKILQVQRKRLFIGLVLVPGITLGITAGLAGCSKPEEGGASAGGANAPARDPVPVTVRPVTVRTAQRYVEVTGTLFGEEEVTISNKVPGKIIAIYKDVGDR